ncbi:MAG TPA: aminotransferase class V-fold PLP-dependent enzyme [Micromonosporaceae bacterium]|nr:aminotransferase class V-fold PLP-dependent enzyme [Micromonosporaceae bacterium]
MTAGAYLDYAGIGVVRPAARAAMRAAVDDVLAYGATRFGDFFAARDGARDTAARLLECHPDEVALVPNTSTGLHLVADGLCWRPGDEVVLFDRDFPANVQPWRRLAERGVRLRWVPPHDGGYRMADLAQQIGPATRLVAVSHVNFLTGFRVDLDAVCALAAEVGALVCVDAVQALGVVPLSVRRTPVDFLAAGGHKWLCGPPGTGLFYSRRDRLDLLRLAPAGWFGYDRSQDMLVKGEGHFTYELPLRPAARRFEGGMPNFLGIVGLAAALAELAEVGVATVWRRVGSLGERLRAGLRERGYPVLGPDDLESRSGIITFAAGDAGRIFADLTARGLQVSYPDGKIRISPHFWTTDGEVEQLLEALPRQDRDIDNQQ